MKKITKAAYLIATIFFVVNAVNVRLNLNPLYPSTAFFYCIMITAYVAIWVINKAGKFIFTKLENGSVSVDFERKAPFPKAPIIIAVAAWVLYGAVTVGSSVIFNVSAFRDQMPDYRIGDFSSEIQVVDISQIPIVDNDLAYKIAEKKLGEKPSLGSQVVLGEPTIQTVNDKLVWVVPLQHSGFFKWLTNMAGTPGYIVVSATNSQDVEYVDDYNIKYQPNAYIFSDLTFHTRYTAALFTGVTDYSFELDDTGRPHWVITTFRYTRGFALPEATGVIVMDAETGKSNRYALEDVPAWVDRVQPEDFILTQINNKGKYVHGIFNWADKDKYQTSEGDIIVYDEGRCYLFTGITSVGSDESAIGFVMVDMVTKEPIMYQMAGATEYAAQRSAEGKVQQYGYYASFPLIINFEGTPTYFMTLKDIDGLIKQYAYVSVKDFLVVGVGESMQDAKLNYEKALRQNPGSADVTDSDSLAEIAGTVYRINQEIVAGETVYRFILSERTDIVFEAQGSVSEMLSLTEVGDSVKISYRDTASPIKEVKAFENTGFGDLNKAKEQVFETEPNTAEEITADDETVA
ncbi:MAG: hypothetical protein J6J58_06250 [Oscillospiraceae bacterium]|nr:hypothetical protein [Oscillospiraceae bacterium]MBQ5325030.1 hypothetical protein [Oscillospiraceae bacterium]